MQKMHNLDSALDHYEKALEIRQSERDNQAAAFDITMSMAECYSRRGDIAEANKLYQECIVRGRMIFGENSSAVGRCYEGLAML